MVTSYYSPSKPISPSISDSKIQANLNFTMSTSQLLDPSYSSYSIHSIHSSNVHGHKHPHDYHSSQSSDFYRNGQPAEVIVISDDEDEIRIEAGDSTTTWAASELPLGQEYVHRSTNHNLQTSLSLSTDQQISLAHQGISNNSTTTNNNNNNNVDEDDDEVIVVGQVPASSSLTNTSSSSALASPSSLSSAATSVSSELPSLNLKRKSNRLDSPSHYNSHFPIIEENGPPTPHASSNASPNSTQSELEYSRLGGINNDNNNNNSSLKNSSSKKKRKLSYFNYIPIKGPIIKSSDVAVKTITDKGAYELPPLQDDKDGHLVLREPITAIANGRFIIRNELGQGTFGKVVSAYDKINQRYCAIKIIRAIPKYREASRTELRVLSTIQKYDKSNIYKCIHLQECFNYRNHICIVTDLLAISVYDFLKSNKYMAFPASHIQSFARQLLTSVCFLHDLDIIHTDLKPENIMLKDAKSFSYYDPGKKPHEFKSAEEAAQAKKDPSNYRKVLKNTSINLIDFGSAVFSDEFHNHVVSTRHYRAPEIILGIGWSHPCDIWSVGCILVELCTGEALFHTHDNSEHLALMQKAVGRDIDRAILQRASKNSIGAELVCRTRNNRKNSVGDDGSTASINKTGQIRVHYPRTNTTSNSIKQVEAMHDLKTIIYGCLPSLTEKSESFWSQFLNLLYQIFQFDPKKRITARKALEHPWLRHPVDDEGSEYVSW